MWCPEGYHSWGETLGTLYAYASEILSLVAVGGEPAEQGDGKKRLIHTAEFYLERRGMAESEEEAELVIGITTSLLLTCLFEEYPPVLAHLNGSKIQVDENIFRHRDQLEHCYFNWPLREQSEFSQFFEFQKQGKFNIDSLFDRFCFIDSFTGEIINKNGSRDYLVNGWGLEEDQADSIIRLVRSLSGFVVCWRDLPNGQDLRDFLSCIEANDTFTRALDYEFGSRSAQFVTDRISRRKRIGRPSMRSEVAKIYRTKFPDGHAAQGKTWKVALAEVNAALKSPVSEDTLKRAVLPLQ